MKNAINIGNNLNTDTISNVANMIATIFKAGQEAHMEQATIVAALELAGNLTRIENITIRDCEFTYDGKESNCERVCGKSVKGEEASTGE